MAALLTLRTLVFRTSVLVDVGRYQSTLDGPHDGPDGPETAQERSWIELVTT
jgi:hypothetical protein